VSYWLYSLWLWNIAQQIIIYQAIFIAIFLAFRIGFLTSNLVMGGAIWRVSSVSLAVFPDESVALMSGNTHYRTIFIERISMRSYKVYWWLILLIWLAIQHLLHFKDSRSRRKVVSISKFFSIIKDQLLNCWASRISGRLLPVEFERLNLLDGIIKWAKLALIVHWRPRSVQEHLFVAQRKISIFVLFTSF